MRHSHALGIGACAAILALTSCRPGQHAVAEKSATIKAEPPAATAAPAGGGSPISHVTAGPPVLAPLPAGQNTNACQRPALPSLQPGVTPGYPTVDANPESVTALWYPGLNTHPCTEPITHGSAALASRLATDIQTGTPWAPGNYNCPMDDGSGVALYFSYRGRSQAEWVLANPRGCSSIIAPNRSPALELGQLQTDVLPLVPHGFQWAYSH